jgi:hypothetical protein
VLATSVSRKSGADGRGHEQTVHGWARLDHQDGETHGMVRTLRHIVLGGFIVALTADVVLAGFLPDPFEFSFFTPALTTLFLLPFQLAGCA